MPSSNMRILPEKSSELTTAFHDLRQPNEVKCVVLESDSPLISAESEVLFSVFETLVEEVGGNLQPQWEAVDFDRARDAIELTLRFEMAYATQCMTEPEASALATRFLDQFEGGQAFIAGYDLTDATYQMTIVAVTERAAGILYVDDED